MNDVYNENGKSDTSMSDLQISTLPRLFHSGSTLKISPHRFLVGLILLVLKLIGQVRVVCHIIYKMV